jgi:hypothetical protein
MVVAQGHEAFHSEKQAAVNWTFCVDLSTDNKIIVNTTTNNTAGMKSVTIHHLLVQYLYDESFGTCCQGNWEIPLIPSHKATYLPRNTGHEVLMAVKMLVFWVVTSCGLVGRY